MKNFNQTEKKKEFNEFLIQFCEPQEEVFNFGSFNDSVFNYGFHFGNELETLVDISFIADDTLVNPMSFEDFLNLKEIKYFSVTVYERLKGTENWNDMESLDWTIHDETV